MRPETKAALGDALVASEEILALVGNRLEQVLEERVNALAIERLLLIVGEALVRVRAAEPDLLNRISDAGAIIGMRNVIVHGYDAIDSARIRDALRDNLPLLRQELTELIS